LGQGGIFSGFVVLVVVIGFILLKPSIIPKPFSPQLSSGFPMIDFLPLVQDISINQVGNDDDYVDFRKGNENAKVVIVEFSDFQCPACSRAANMMSQMVEKYKEHVLLVFRNYPLSFHILR